VRSFPLLRFAPASIVVGLVVVGSFACSSGSDAGGGLPVHRTSAPPDGGVVAFPEVEAGVFGSGPGGQAGEPPPVPRNDPPPVLPHALADGGAAPTWTDLYAKYFGPGSLGHCGNAGCHDNVRDHFRCGASKDDCYQGLVDGHWISSTDPLHSQLANPDETPLSWFASGGNMPDDKRMPNPTAADEIGAWVFAGAKND
jgi:hypothetical protein